MNFIGWRSGRRLFQRIFAGDETVPTGTPGGNSLHPTDHVLQPGESLADSSHESDEDYGVGLACAVTCVSAAASYPLLSTMPSYWGSGGSGFVTAVSSPTFVPIGNQGFDAVLLRHLVAATHGVQAADVALSCTRDYARRTTTVSLSIGDKSGQRTVTDAELQAADAASLLWLDVVTDLASALFVADRQSAMTGKRAVALRGIGKE